MILLAGQVIYFLKINKCCIALLRLLLVALSKDAVHIQLLLAGQMGVSIHILLLFDQLSLDLRLSSTLCLIYSQLIVFALRAFKYLLFMISFVLFLIDFLIYLLLFIGIDLHRVFLVRKN